MVATTTGSTPIQSGKFIIETSLAGKPNLNLLGLLVDLNSQDINKV